MNPVHSSLAPLLEEPGHFHAMTFLLGRLSYSSVGSAQVNASHARSCPKDTEERPGRPNDAGFAGLLHQSIVNSHQLGVVVILEHELTGPHFRFLAQENLGPKMPLQFIDRSPNIRVHMNFRRRTRSPRAPGTSPFNLPHR